LVVACRAELAGEKDHTVASGEGARIFPDQGIRVADLGSADTTPGRPGAAAGGLFQTIALPRRHRVIQGTLPRGSFFEGQLRDMAIGENHRNIQPFA